VSLSMCLCVVCVRLYDMYMCAYVCIQVSAFTRARACVCVCVFRCVGVYELLVLDILAAHITPELKIL